MNRTGDAAGGTPAASPRTVGKTTAAGPAQRPSSTQIIFFGNGPLADTTLKYLNFGIVFHAKTREDLDAVRTLKRAHPELKAVLASYGSFVPSDVLELFEPEGILNIHPSKLPEYRGPSPIETAILDGKTNFSVSIMKLVKEMDAGPIYYQATLKNLPLNKAKIYEALAAEGAYWLNKNFTQLPPPFDQQGEPTFTHKFEKSDGRIDPTAEPANQIHRKIIAFQTFPKVKYDFYGRTCAILESRLTESGERPLLPLECADGKILSIDRLQPDGKKPMDAKSFINGYCKK